jgi:sugar lactone lactonase YvrE
MRARAILAAFLALSCVSLLPAAGKLELFVGNSPELAMPFGIDFLADGTLVVADFAKSNIVLVDKTGKARILAGAGKKGSKDGKGTEALFNGPHNAVVRQDGKIVVGDSFNHLIKLVDPVDGTTTPAAARYNDTYHVALKGADLLVADLGNRRIRLMGDMVSTVAGNGMRGAPKDGAKATEAPLVDPRACAADDKGNLYILERGGNALRVVDAKGVIRTVVGSGKAGPVTEGPGTECTLNSPKFLWVEKDGNVLIADSSNHAIRRYHPATGMVKTVAGTGKAGKGEPGGDPLATALKHPHGVAVDIRGTLYISDSENGRILKLVP